jgi:hypothetical protein
MTRILALVPLLAALVSAEMLAAQDTAAKLAELGKAYADVRANHLKPVGDLEELYARNLEALRKEATEAGELEHVLAIKAEIESFRKQETPPVGDEYPKLKHLQGIYRQSRLERLTIANESLASATKAYVDSLTAIQIDLTKQERLEEAVEVKAVIDSLKEGKVPAKTPSAPGKEAAAPKLDVPGAAMGSPLTFRQGRLHLIAGAAPDTPILDITSAAGITDFVDVCANAGTWAALRVDGTALGWSSAKKAGFMRKGIVKLLQTSHGPGDAVCGIDSNGSVINLLTGESVIDPPAGRKVVDAGIRGGHGLALFDDGSVKAWGIAYQSGTDPKQKLAEAPPRSLEGISFMAVSRYSAMTVDRQGDLFSWGAPERTQLAVSKPIREVTGIWGISTNDCLIEVQGKKAFLYRQEFGREAKLLNEFSPSPAVVRCSEYGAIGLFDGIWRPLDRIEVYEAAKLLDPLAALGSDALPVVWLNIDGGGARGNLLWLKAD